MTAVRDHPAWPVIRAVVADPGNTEDEGGRWASGAYGYQAEIDADALTDAIVAALLAESGAPDVGPPGGLGALFRQMRGLPPR